jgi:DNA-binding FrmR family transcriptional regulator
MPNRRAPEDDSSKDKLLARLRSIEGHVRSIADMVGRDAYCIEVLQQTRAVTAAVAKVEMLLLERHLQHCVQTVVRSDDKKERERVLRELIDVFDAKR